MLCVVVILCHVNGCENELCWKTGTFLGYIGAMSMRRLDTVTYRCMWVSILLRISRVALVFGRVDYSGNHVGSIVVRVEG